MASPRGGGGQLGAIAPPPTVIRSTPEIRANPKSLGGGGGEGDKRKAESNESIIMNLYFYLLLTLLNFSNYIILSFQHMYIRTVDLCIYLCTCNK